jgi:serine/threonine-protein kinase
MIVSRAKRSAGTLAPGAMIGEYEIVEKIGQGGVAEIYRGRQTSLDREVAIKLLSEHATIDSEIVSRFEQEARIIARLSHPNIVHVIDRGVDKNRYYFVMDHVDGHNFKKILSNGTYSFEKKIDVVVNLLKALDYAHKNGIVHRDVKPSNILIDRRGFVMVADFGIAQMFDKKGADRTRTEMVMGTLAYMSPEQKLSSGKVDCRTDLYAVGVILYEITTGRKPLGRFKPPSEVNPKVSRKLNDIVLKCLDQDPKDRYQTAVELKDDLLSAVYDKKPADESVAQEDGTTVAGFVGNCTFLDTLKETQFGATYLVENRVDGKLYVIKKTIRREMGLREAKILAKLDHPNIIKIHGAGGDANKNVIVTEYAQGGSLADRLVKPYPVGAALTIFKQIASALNLAHRNNIVHGNLRPSNILFDPEDRVKLTDFSLPEHYPKKGKNWYAAPERKKERSSDVYSAGVILHQLLTNQIPIFDSYGRLIWQSGQIGIPPEITNLVAKMLRRDTSERCCSFEEILAEIEQSEKTSERSKERGAWQARRIKLLRKPRRARLLTLILLLILVAVVVAFLVIDPELLHSLFA